ncbi:MAG: hypothetical protein HWE25_06775 [Alphaproteobacteria bacterium]|nr:hypothetical protein [Alphaproteobacteria bacterium]
MKKLVMATALLALAACSGKGDEIVFDTTLGPRSEAQADSLPNTLEGDRANARHSGTSVKGQGMESTDGSED